MKALLIIKGKIDPCVHWWNLFFPIHFFVHQKISLPALPVVGGKIHRDVYSESHLVVKDVYFDCNVHHETDIRFDFPCEENRVVTGTFVITCSLKKQLNLSQGSEEEYLGGHIRTLRDVRSAPSKDVYMERREKEALERIDSILKRKIESVTGYSSGIIKYEPKSWARTFS